jgi:hypothetical protein
LHYFCGSALNVHPRNEKVSISQFQEHEFFSVSLVIRISYISNISALNIVVTIVNNSTPLSTEYEGAGIPFFQCIIFSDFSMTDSIFD